MKKSKAKIYLYSALLATILFACATKKEEPKDRYIIKDHDEAFKITFTRDYNWVRRLAEKGNPVAQNRLGNMYSQGEGVPHDEQKSYEWIKKSAEQGYDGGQLNLALIYYSKGNSEEGQKLLEKSAAQGNWMAKEYLKGTYGELKWP